MGQAESSIRAIIERREAFATKAESIMKYVCGSLGMKVRYKEMQKDVCFFVVDMSAYKIAVSHQTLFAVVDQKISKET